MEQGDQNYSQVESDAAGGANAMPARASRRSSSRKRKNRRPKTELRKKTLHATYDHNSVGYEWLRSGWIAEEYITKSGRTYKRYFDERGRPYNTKREVLKHYAEWDQIYNEEGNISEE